jgi:hypothetical protein
MGIHKVRLAIRKNIIRNPEARSHRAVASGL